MRGLIKYSMLYMEEGKLMAMMGDTTASKLCVEVKEGEAEEGTDYDEYKTIISRTTDHGEGGQNCWCTCVRQCMAKRQVPEAKCSKKCSEACEKADYGGMPIGGLKFCKWRDASKMAKH
ncbi:uncharacterized protein A4U43_C06F15960 [Asparagus officinalis]|uniref:Uncharacterized protein n=1 Tax=Asparagus officinalis TaxID=4686 RepID=A0A5P1EMU4_ASPOF|nr:uncharacterized protein A4U43_C06F15960 [Asparagus officinalis]